MGLGIQFNWTRLTGVLLQAAAPKEVLYNIRQSDVTPSQAFEIQTFLHRLSSAHLGFTALKLFNVNREALLAVSAERWHSAAS